MPRILPKCPGFTLQLSDELIILIHISDVLSKYVIYARNMILDKWGENKN